MGTSVMRDAIRFTPYSLDWPIVPEPTTRALSAALFGNEKMVEVLLALDAQHGAATAQQLRHTSGIDHSLVRSVLLRAVAAGIVDALPRTGGSRSPQYYQPADSDLWRATVELARTARASATRPQETRRR